MTSEQIAAEFPIKDGIKTVELRKVFWLKEIAYQLAVANEREAERDKPINVSVDTKLQVEEQQ